MKKRTNKQWLRILAVCLLIASLAFTFLTRFCFTAPPLVSGLLLLLSVAAWVMCVVAYRCPYCGRLDGMVFFETQCRHCGREIGDPFPENHSKARTTVRTIVESAIPMVIVCLIWLFL